MVGSAATAAIFTPAPQRVPHATSQAGALTGFAASFFEGPIDFYKSQIQVQIIRSKSDPNYKRESPM